MEPGPESKCVRCADQRLKTGPACFRGSDGLGGEACIVFATEVYRRCAPSSGHRLNPPLPPLIALPERFGHPRNPMRR